MSRKKGTPNKITAEIKTAVESAFRQKNGKHNRYLLRLADENPAIFCALVAKCIPATVAVDVKVALDLGAAMLKNEQSLQRLNAPTIDSEPVTPAKPLILKDT